MPGPLILPEFEAGLAAGDALLYLPGSGLAQPQGLEAKFIYRDLVMNDMSKIDKFKIDEIDGLGDPEIRDAREPLPADHGEQALRAFYGGRPLSITGRIQVGNIPKLRDMEMAMRSAFARLTESPLVISTGDDDTAVYVNCRKVAPRSAKESQADRLYKRDFLLQLRASNPRIFSVRTYSVVGNLDGNNSLELKPLQGGNFDARPVIRLHGPIGGLEMTCEETGRRLWFKAGKYVPERSVYTIDVQRRTMYDSQGNNRFSTLDPRSKRLELPPRTSTIGVQASFGEGSLVELIYRATWI